MEQYTSEDFMPTKEELELREKLLKSMELRDAMNRAIDAGDEKEAKRLAALIKVSPWMAESIKSIYGLDVLKSIGYDMSDVIAEYGEEWLEKEDEIYLELKEPMEIIQKMQKELWKEEGKI